MQKSKYIKDTSWQKSARWYSKIVSDKGHYYHQNIIIPNVIKLLNLQSGLSILDLACGQGVMARNLPKDVEYVGIDNAPSLIQEAKRLDKNIKHQYIIGDVTKFLPVPKNYFDLVVIILALQNIKYPNLVIKEAFDHLNLGGKLIVVLNHPCFRIPRQSSWGVDQGKKIEYRRIDKYMSEMEIPITTHPGQGNSPITWSFHHPISQYFKWLKETSFVIENLEEWVSDKESVGKAAKMENRSRSEFPLFMAISAKKI